MRATDLEKEMSRSRLRFACCLLSAGILMNYSPGRTWAADQPTPEQLVKQLECRAEQDCAPPAPVSRKRGLSPGGTKRSFSFETATEPGRQEVEKRVEAGKLPSADLEVYFDFNSAVVSPQAREMLRSLGVALNDPRLAGFNFVLVGHTDGKGTATFNQRLSEKRAAAVKDHLVGEFQIAPERLTTFGRGKTVLKNVADPTAAENRRVQVINQGAVAAGR